MIASESRRYMYAQAICTARVPQKPAAVFFALSTAVFTSSDEPLRELRRRFGARLLSCSSSGWTAVQPVPDISRSERSDVLASVLCELSEELDDVRETVLVVGVSPSPSPAYLRFVPSTESHTRP